MPDQSGPDEVKRRDWEERRGNHPFPYLNGHPANPVIQQPGHNVCRVDTLHSGWVESLVNWWVSPSHWTLLLYFTFHPCMVSQANFLKRLSFSNSFSSLSPLCWSCHLAGVSVVFSFKRFLTCNSSLYMWIEERPSGFSCVVRGCWSCVSAH